jgi:hypothetical protein
MTESSDYTDEKVINIINCSDYGSYGSYKIILNKTNEAINQHDNLSKIVEVGYLQIKTLGKLGEGNFQEVFTGSLGGELYIFRKLNKDETLFFNPDFPQYLKPRFKVKIFESWFLLYDYCKPKLTGVYDFLSKLSLEIMTLHREGFIHSDIHLDNISSSGNLLDPGLIGKIDSKINIYNKSLYESQPTKYSIKMDLIQLNKFLQMDKIELGSILYNKYNTELKKHKENEKLLTQEYKSEMLKMVFLILLSVSLEIILAIQSLDVFAGKSPLGLITLGLILPILNAFIPWFYNVNRNKLVIFSVIEFIIISLMYITSYLIWSIIAIHVAYIILDSCFILLTVYTITKYRFSIYKKWYDAGTKY